MSLKKELQGVYHFTKRNYREMVVISSAVLFLTLNEYHLIINRWFSALLYFAIAPILIIVVLLWENPLDFGLRFGSPRIWSFHVAIACLIGLPIIYIVSHFSAFQSYYAIEKFAPLNYVLITGAYLFAWEFLFRGFILFGLKEKLREGSIIVQMIPFVLLHFGKPELETISTILMGLYFGYIVYRGNSYWPAFLVHLFINITLIFLVNLK
jgi:membrane protease YdiL (CAAX protease family)